MTRYFFITVLLTVVCVFPSFAARKKEVIAASNIKFEGKNTNIKNLLEIDGYYYSAEEYKTKSGIMFFEDGTYVSFFFKDNATEEGIKTNMSLWIESWIKNRKIRWGIRWGIYRIDRDTLVVHDYVRAGLWGREWSIYEIRYKIIDRTTIQRIYIRSALKSDDSYYITNNPWKKNDPASHFISCDSLPSSDCWLKEEKWIWRNESDWEAYMKQIKTKK